MTSVPSQDEPIAIVGIGLRLPGDSPDDLGHLLNNKVDAITTDIPKDRWTNNKFLDERDLNRPGYTVSKQSGFVMKDHITKFDPEFFKLNRKEANRMDPQQRMILETTYRAFEDAGFDINSYAGSKTGVFAGIFTTTDYQEMMMQTSKHMELNGQSPMGSCLPHASNRVSYLFDFQGPSFTGVDDTACSSSAMIATHLACNAIWNGECNLAVSCEANALLSPENFTAFDKSVNDYVRSEEGAGAVLLKPLSQALKDNDKVYACILGSTTATNEDGCTNGIMPFPSYDAQKEVIGDALNRSSGVNPADISYVELYGTEQTAVGDPIETRSVGDTIATHHKKAGKGLIVGSVKSNIGYRKAVSGISGLAKLCLVLKNQQVPPNIHLYNPNPKIELEKCRLQVVTEQSISISDEGDCNKPPVFGCLNSFSFGGSNVHAVLRSAPEVSFNRRVEGVDDGLPQLFSISGHSDAALREYATSYLQLLNNDSSANMSLTDICYTASARRTHHDIRLASAPASKDELKQLLQAFLDGEKYKNLTSNRVSNSKKHRIAFIFSGQGAQWHGMGKELFDTHPTYRKVMLEVDAEMKKLVGWSIVEELSKTSEDSNMHKTTVAQPCIFAMQVALAYTWMSYGVKPEGIVGHSIGEVAAAHMSGALSLAEATAIIFHRSRLQASTAGKGRMLAIGLPQEEVERELRGWENKVQVAAVRSPKNTVIAGDIDAILRFNEDFDKRGIFNRLLRLDSAFHSHHMEPVKEELLSELSFLTASPTSTDLYSTVTGEMSEGSSLNNEYWYRNVRETVLFTKAVSNMIQDGYNVFVEIAPHPILSGGVEELLKNLNKNGKIVHSVRRKEPEMSSMIGSLGGLHCWGVKMDWASIFPKGNMVSLLKIPENMLNNNKLSKSRLIGRKGIIR